MNRQARRADIGSSWESFGGVTFATAAKQYAMANRVTNPCKIEVRDKDDPDTIHTFEVRMRREYIVTGLRGGV